MKIVEVIERHGMQPSALQSAIDRNLTVKTLRQISEAARIPIAEFFLDEMTQEEISRLTDRPSPDPSLSGRGVDTTEPQDNSRPSIQQAIICPHCKKAMTITVQA